MKKKFKKNKKTKSLNLKKEYQESWEFIKDSKNFLWVVLGIFFFFSVLGFFITPSETFSKMILDFIKELLSKTQGMSLFQLMRFIFFNNVQSSFFGMVFGIFLGILPFISVIANGYLLGFASHLAVQEAGVFSLWRILPHGIFELPAMFISFSLGLRLGFSVFNKKKFGSLEKNFLSSIKAFALIVFPLLIIAAIIESSLIFLSS